MVRCDIEYAKSHGAKIIVTNTTYEMFPEADALYAMDFDWWRDHGDKVLKNFKGQCYTSSRFAANKFKVWYVHRESNNSGSQSILLAEKFGASAILLLGFDGKGGHWHPPHKRTSIPGSQKFQHQGHVLVSQKVKVPVINCTRDTSVTAFPTMTLEDAICRVQS